MRGRPAIFDNEKLLMLAQQVFWTKGYTATSLSDLLDAMSIGSGSFYNSFKGGKKEVFSRAIQQRRADFNAFKIELNKNETPVRLIKDFFLSIASDSQDTHMKGCIIANTVAEMTLVDQDLADEAIEILKEVEHMFTETIRKAQQSGELQNTTDAALLGRYLITLWNGLNVTRRMYPHGDLLRKQIEMQLEIIS